MFAEWESHKSQLRAYIEHQLDEKDSVEDILQEVYIKASKNIRQLQSKGSLKSWLYAITRNTIMDHYRKRKSFEALPDDIAPEPQNTVEENHKILASCIKPLLEELPDKYRIPLELSELEGVSQKEIAVKLGLSVSGAKSRVQRARAKLREVMLSYCDFELSKSGVTDFTPKNKQGQKYYNKICKRYT